MLVASNTSVSLFIFLFVYLVCWLGGQLVRGLDFVNWFEHSLNEKGLGMLVCKEFCMANAFDSALSQLNDLMHELIYQESYICVGSNV